MRRLWNRHRDNVRIFDDAILRAPAVPVDDFDDSLRALVDRLLRVQKRTRALGVAATQIGERASVFVVNGGEIREHGVPEVLVNPRLLESDGEETGEEGCLSFPGVFVPIRRPFRVHLRAQDANGAPIEREAHGLLARVYCHELDHLEGRLIIDCVAPPTRERIIQKMKHRSGSHRSDR